VSGAAGGSRLPRSNSVNSATGENPASEESGGYEEAVIEAAAERVEKFRDEYPHLAGQPLSEQPGQKLREAVIEEEYVEEYVKGEGPMENGHTVERLERVEAVTWAEAMFTFLVERQPYDDGVGGRFRDRQEDETFTVDFHDCWTTEYGEEQAARNFGAQRQLMGGAYPDDVEDSERAGEVEMGEWSGDTATIMLTRTGSSTPGGERMPPVDHADRVARTWSEGNVYDTVRNICEHELGLEPEQWGYVRGDDVHGIEPHPTDDGEAGENACYVHSHDAIYIDLGATELREVFDSDVEVRAVLESTFYKAIEKHLEACELAKPEAHTREEAVEVRLDLDQPAGYATEYLRLDEKEMMEMPVEFQAFAAVEWATNRQRIARSKIFTDAAKADFCEQDPEVVHGSDVGYDDGGHGEGEVVCVHCGSGVGIDAGTVAEHRLTAGDEADDDEEELEQIGVRVGESPGSARARSRAEEYVEEHGREEPVAVVMGELGLAPHHREVVEEVLAGENTAEEAEPVMGEGKPPKARHELEAVVMPDGGEEEVSGSGGGGVSTVRLKLPEQRLLRETRLSHVGVLGRPKIVVEDGERELATYDPEVAAGALVEWGYREPWHAELALSFTRHGKGVPGAFEERVARPPSEVSGEGGQ